MAIYVDSVGGSNTSPYDTWAKAATSITSATGATAGEEVLVSSAHSEAGFTVATTLDFTGGTLASPVKVISANSTTSAYERGGEIWTDNATTHDLTISGHVHFYGIDFTQSGSADLQLTELDAYFLFEDCDISVGRTIGFNSTRSQYKFKGIGSGNTLSCGYLFSSQAGLQITIENCAVTTTSSTRSFWTYGTGTDTRLIDCDLTGITDTVLNGDVLPEKANRMYIKRCQLPTGWTLSAFTARNYEPSAGWFIEDSKSGTVSVATLGIETIENYYGTISMSSAVYRTGGADDGFQANAYSVSMATTANTVENYAALSTTLASKVIAADVSPTGATSRGIVTSTRSTLRATPAALTTDSVSTWNGTGVGTKQKISHTLNNSDTLTVYLASGSTLNDDDFWIEVMEPDQVGGLVTVKAFLAKPSTTVYVDPKMDIA